MFIQCDHYTAAFNLYQCVFCFFLKTSNIRNETNWCKNRSGREVKGFEAHLLSYLIIYCVLWLVDRPFFQTSLHLAQKHARTQYSEKINLFLHSLIYCEYMALLFSLVAIPSEIRTDPFTTLELYKIRRSPDLVAFKLWKGGSGCSFILSSFV